MAPRLLPAVAIVTAAWAQTVCPPTPVYSPCDIVFGLPAGQAAAHPNPYLSVQLQAEFRSPRHQTFLMPGFWDGGTRLVVRFAPTAAGTWDFRVSSNIAAFDGKLGQLTATESGSPGFIRPANVHHWAWTGSGKAHLWMGDTSYRFAFLDRALFERVIDARAAQKFNHLRGVIVESVPSPDQPDPAHFRELDQRILYMNRKGIIADLILAGDENHLVKLFPGWQQRERYIRYVVARYAAMNVTWQLVQEFEEYEDGRELLKQVGLLLKRLDPYQHPRTAHTLATASPLAADGWMDHVLYQSSRDELGAIEHQLYALPQVNAEFAYEDSGAGRSHPHHVDADTFRKRLWNAAMNGQYPTFGNTGVYGGRKFSVEAKYLDSPGARQMTAWYDFFSRTRHWELEPYFDVDGGRALALDDVEYIIYVEKPGPVEVLVARHGYDVAWFNPLTGESVKMKDFKGERFTGEPPDRQHDWVLHISREGRKQSMLNSYKFESRPTPMQEVELNPQKTPFEIVAPAADEISLASPPRYAVKLKRETRATRAMMYLWTAESAVSGQGSRVVGYGAEGVFAFPRGLVKTLPTVLNVRLTGMNANGKVYSTGNVYTVKP